MMDRPEMMPKPAGIYDFDFSEIPDHVRISFSNGTTAIYDLRTTQPHPLALKNVEIMKETQRKITQGYVNQPMRRRRRKT